MTIYINIKSIIKISEFEKDIYALHSGSPVTKRERRSSHSERIFKSFCKADVGRVARSYSGSKIGHRAWCT
jgi:hypothetical protein